MTRGNSDIRTHGEADQAHRYDSLGAGYDRWYERPANAFIDRIEKHHLRAALPSPGTGRTLLEVGCGTCHWFPVFDEEGYLVVGVDISDGMLSVARAKFGWRLDLVRSDALRLPFGDAVFDVTCSIATLHLVADYFRVLDEMYRCLRPGGRLVVGALNAISFLGVKRRLTRSAFFKGTRFLTVRKVRQGLARYGRPWLVTCAFTPPVEWLLPVARWIETAGTRLLPGTGQFIVTWIDKPGKPES
jgi:ubiquinone/menaquinone biosynthesis C-methylase UbiE